MANVTIFDRPYPTEKQAEGIAVFSAIMSGKCNDCQSYAECTTNDHFKFPIDAYCMRQKAIILKGWGKDGK